MNIPVHYSEQLPFREQILYVLSVLKKGAASEVAMELMELKGISSEEGVADLTVETGHELEKMFEAGSVEVVKEKREKKRYALKH
jgi:hypothetical protein